MSTSPPAPTNPSLVEAGQHVVASKHYLCAAFAILVYDHLLTFSDEVEYIWSRKRGVGMLVTGVFLVNRYYTTLAMVAIMIAFFDVNWSAETCQNFVHFEPFGFGIPLIAITGALLILRVFALYGRNLYILAYLGALLIAQVTVGIWQFAFPGGGPVVFPPVPGLVFHGCLYITAPSLGAAASAYLVIDLAFDISIFVLTMAKTWQAFWGHRGPGLLRRISQDGALYFVVIFTSNSAWLFLLLFATPDLKYIQALPGIIFDVIMINRLTLSLRRTPDQPASGHLEVNYRRQPPHSRAGPWNGESIQFTPRQKISSFGEEYELDSRL
ncbi:hypothetical protein K439DRAFT_1628916 [Ramaria rubella]|nr:hypothetical protein K439DRAFT_1628916 [Ramaria rubella]